MTASDDLMTLFPRTHCLPPGGQGRRTWHRLQTVSNPIQKIALHKERKAAAALGRIAEDPRGGNAAPR